MCIGQRLYNAENLSNGDFITIQAESDAEAVDALLALVAEDALAVA